MGSQQDIDDNLARLKADTEAMPDGAEKEQLRQAHRELQQVLVEGREFDAKMEVMLRAARRQEATERLMMLAIGLAILFLPLYAVFNGRTFLPDDPPLVWKADPSAFAILMVAEIVCALVFLLGAGGLTYFGPPPRRSLEEIVRERREQAERRSGVPWWVTALVIGCFLLLCAHAVIKMS